MYRKVIVDEGNQAFDRRLSPGAAKYDVALRRIALGGRAPGSPCPEVCATYEPECQAVLRAFFGRYSPPHHHTGLGLTTPGQVHYRQAYRIHAARQIILDRAFIDYPERFVTSQRHPPNKPPSG